MKRFATLFRTLLTGLRAALAPPASRAPAVEITFALLWTSFERLYAEWQSGALSPPVPSATLPPGPRARLPARLPRTPRPRDARQSPVPSARARVAPPIPVWPPDTGPIATPSRAIAFFGHFSFSPPWPPRFRTSISLRFNNNKPQLSFPPASR
jgi:hypothetical protein